MRKYLIFGLILVCLLLFGCIGEDTAKKEISNMRDENTLIYTDITARVPKHHRSESECRAFVIYWRDSSYADNSDSLLRKLLAYANSQNKPYECKNGIMQAQRKVSEYRASLQSLSSCMADYCDIKYAPQRDSERSYSQIMECMGILYPKGQERPDVRAIAYSSVLIVVNGCLYDAPISYAFEE